VPVKEGHLPQWWKGGATIVTERFALIDNRSGYVWWVGDATTPEAACQRATVETGGPGDTNFEKRSWLFIGGPGYLVYLAPAGFDIYGQDSATLAIVRALPFLGLYSAVVGNDDDA
jgi:hypothetical protein